MSDLTRALSPFGKRVHLVPPRTDVALCGYRCTRFLGKLAGKGTCAECLRKKREG